MVKNTTFCWCGYVGSLKTEMSCGELLLKSASSTFTGYFLIISIAFILYGLSSTYYLLKTNSVDTLENEFVSVPSLCLIVFGILLLVFIIVGCCAICREIPCCLEAYAICLAILASAQIGLGIFCLLRFQMNNPEFEQRIENDVSKMFWDYDDDPRQMDSTQQWMKCCGVLEASDWLKSNRSLPASCCKDVKQNCNIASTWRFEKGCATMVLGYIIGTNYIIGWSLIVVGITELVGAMMGISLSCAFWRNNRIMWI